MPKSVGSEGALKVRNRDHIVLQTHLAGREEWGAIQNRTGLVFGRLT